MHIDQIKKIMSVQQKIESIDQEILAINNTVKKIQNFEKDAVINMHISVVNPLEIPESNGSYTVNNIEDFQQVMGKLKEISKAYDKQTSLSYDLSETDLLVIFSGLVKIKTEAKSKLIEELKNLGVTDDLSKSETKRSKKTR